MLDCKACCDAVVQVRHLIPAALRGVQDPTPPKRDVSGKWREVTLVDKGLPMREYLHEAVKLFPRAVTGKGMGPVLRAVVREVSELQGGVVSWLAAQERSLNPSACLWHRAHSARPSVRLGPLPGPTGHPKTAPRVPGLVEGVSRGP